MALGDVYANTSADGFVDRIPARADDAELLTVQEAARFLKVTVSWIYEHVRPGAHDRLPVLKVGKYLRFDARDLRAYIDAKREAAGAGHQHGRQQHRRR